MPAALISQMTSPPGEDAEFDAWYGDEHVPVRMAVPGFRGAVRSWAVEGEPKHLVVYHLDDLQVLGSDAYRAVKEHPSERTRHMLETVAAFTRWTCDEISDTGKAHGDAPYSYVVTFDVPADRQAEFDDWYERDHVPTLMRSEHWARVRRYAVVDGEPADVTRIAVHELREHRAALDAPERAEARDSAWRARLTQEPWFGSARYAVYEQAAVFTATHDA